MPGFRQRGIDMWVFSGTPDLGEAKSSDMRIDWETLPPGAMLPAQTVNNVTVQCVRLPDENRIRRHAIYNQTLVRFCRQLENPPDVIHFLSIPLWSVPWLYQLRRMGIPLLYTHTMLGAFSSHRLKRAVQRVVWRVPYQFMDCIVVSSDVMRRTLRDLGVTARIEVIPNGVDTERFRPPNTSDEREGIRRELDIPNDAAVLLSIGPITPRKAPELLLEAFARLAPRHPGLHVVFVGPRHDLAYDFLADFGRKIQNLVEMSGAAQRIHFVGSVSNPEYYLRAADLFVFTSLREGMPNVVPEAMASRVPVIMLPFLGLPEEFGRPGEQYILSDRDPDKLSVAIESLLNSPADRDHFSQAAWKWMNEHMSIEQSLDRYAALYRELSR